MTLEHERELYKPQLPPLLHSAVEVVEEAGGAVDPQVQALFPQTWNQPLVHFKKGKKMPIVQKVGVVLSGGQAPGGHNVIVGLRDALSEGSELFGFLGGPSGILEKKYKKLNDLEHYRNSGGFDLIGSGRTKIESEDQLANAMDTAFALELDGLVVIGGDDSNTNAAVLAEYFKKHGCPTTVVGVPKTIDGDLKHEYIEVSFGFDTASKVYSEMIGNICRDALSAKKYYHFVKLMGRSASHLTLECALQTQPNFTVIGEEVALKQLSLKQIVAAIVDLIVKRENKDYGVILVPEGLLEFIPEMKSLIEDLNAGKVSERSKKTLESLPEEIQQQLQLDRDPHGNVQLSHIETEKLLIEMVKEQLKERSDYRGKFNAIAHFFGYEGRCSYPSNFDANYCYALGFVAEALVANKCSGYMAIVRNLYAAVELWQPGGLPLTQLMHIEMRKGKEKPVIAKRHVDLEGAPYQHFLQNRNEWGMEDVYHFPGPIQLFGPSEICDATTITMSMERMKSAR